MDSFSNYIDHLILLLAARFQAPLEVSTDELLSPAHESANGDPWELVSRTVQLSLCGPQTTEERLSLRHLDVHHFSASVCRERARYVQWKLTEDQARSKAARRTRGRATDTSAEGSAATTTRAETNTKDAVASASTVDPNTNTFDVTRDSLQHSVAQLYALVRQSLPSTLDSDDDEAADDDHGSEGGVVDTAGSEKRGKPQGVVEESSALLNGTAAAAGKENSSAAAASASLAAQVREVFVRTPEERLRDEQAARARDEFLSQIQALQTVYFNKYRRWMEVPASVLEPPPAAATTTTTPASAASSRRSSTSTSAAEAAGRKSNSALHALNQRREEEERASLLAALTSTPAVHTTTTSSRGNSSGPTVVQTTPAMTAAAAAAAAAGPKVRTGVHPTIAAMRRQVHLQRPLRPSEAAVQEAAGVDISRTAPTTNSEPTNTTRRGSASSGVSGAGHKDASASPAMRTMTAGSFSATGAAAAAAAPAAGAGVGDNAALERRASGAAAAAKETAPPASRRGRWQIVEYDDAEDADD